MARPEKISDLNFFVQKLILELKVQRAFEDKRELLQLIENVRKIPIKAFEENYGLIREEIRGIGGVYDKLLRDFNLLLDCCYFLACVREKSENELEAIGEALNKLKNLEKKYEFPCVLEAIEGFLANRIRTCKEREALDRHNEVVCRMKLEFNHDTNVLRYLVQVQVSQISYATLAEKPSEEQKIQKIEEKCDLLAWIFHKIIDDELSLESPLLFTIDTILFNISELESKEISKEKSDRQCTQTIQNALNSISAVSSLSNNLIISKFQKIQEFYEEIQNPAIEKPFQKLGLVTKKADLLLNPPIECLEIYPTEIVEKKVRKGLRTGFINENLCKNDLGLYKKLVTVKFYVGFSIEEIEKYQLEARILSLLSGKKACFLDYYGSYSDINGKQFEFGIVYERIPKTLREDFLARKAKKNYYSLDELKRLCRMLIVALHYMQEEIRDPDVVGIENGIFHLDICPENIFITEDRIYKLGNPNIPLLSRSITTSHLSQLCKDYMAPELIECCNSGIFHFLQNKADIYSIGKIVFEAATLEITFPESAKKRKKAIFKILHQEIRKFVNECTAKIAESRPDITDLKNKFSNLI